MSYSKDISSPAYQQNTYQRKYHRGEIYYVYRDPNYTYPRGGVIDPKAGRPAIIVSRDEDNESFHTLMVVYLTFRDRGNLDTEFTVTTNGLKCKDSKVICHQIQTIDKSLMGDYIGYLCDDDIEELGYCLSTALNINELRNPVYEEEETTDTTVNSDYTSDIIIAKLESERDMFKNLYESLLERVMSK